MSTQKSELKKIKHMAHEARELFIYQVKEANKIAMKVANDTKAAIGEISIIEAKEAVIKEFTRELMR